MTFSNGYDIHSKAKLPSQKLYELVLTTYLTNKYLGRCKYYSIYFPVCSHFKTRKKNHRFRIRTRCDEHDICLEFFKFCQKLCQIQ